MKQLLILVSVFTIITNLLHFSTDYVSGPYNITFLAGSTSTLFYINITDDNIVERVENSEHFVLYIDPLTLPFGTYINSNQFTVHIYDNDSK